ncbi:MAG: ATP-binding protein, partial [Vicinamibacterales bacterium]
MSGHRSLRGSLLAGAALWTVGLLSIVSLVLTQVITSHPAAPVVFHGAFAGTAAHAVFWVVFSIVALAGGVALVRRGVSPVNRLRERLADVHAGRSRRLDGDYPAEIAPLVGDLNALLEDREQRVERAQARAGDLAHGLKTPLAVVAQAAERAAAAGDTEQAAIIAEQVDRMRRQVDHHLALARAGASGAMHGARCDVLESASGLARTLERLHAGRGVRLRVAVPAGLGARARREDLDEMLGNLLDNACLHARAAVAVTATREDGRVAIVVDDDGPGLEPAMWDAVLGRGVRADEAAPGSGFGLAIVRELAELHGGTIAIGRAPLGGLRARLTLPAA